MKKSILALPVLAAVFSLTSCRHTSQDSVEEALLLKQKITEAGLSPANTVVEGLSSASDHAVYVVDKKTNMHYCLDLN
jgi:hypothetical protein